MDTPLAFFPNAYASNYWSSTTFASYPYYVWVVNFGYGIVGHYDKDYVGYVRCVRGGQDNTTPPFGNISINNGSAYVNITSVNLTLSASDPNGVVQMCISNSAICTSWEAYATSKSWTLPSGDGTKSVYVWFKDSAGNVNSTPYSGSIIFDATAPANGTLAATVGDKEVLLSWSGFNDALSGINNYKVVYSTGDTPNSCSSGTQIY